MPTHPLAPFVLGSVTTAVLVFVVVTWRALDRRFGALLATGFVVAGLFTHVEPLRATLGRTFPIGAFVANAIAVGSLFSVAARGVFAAMTDRDVRLVLAFRAIFGAQLFALAATGHLPHAFAISAGLGDLAVGFVALAAPGRLDARGSRAWSVVVHGAGALDLVQVMVLALAVVRPWSIAHGNAAVAMTLPWVAVPLMLAVNLHGLVTALRSTNAEPASDGPEPARRVRGAVPNA